MSDSSAWIKAVRSSHDRLTALLVPLTSAELAAPSYAAEWSIADVASHLGSQAEIFGRFLDAGLANEPSPGGEAFGPIWDRWNALPPEQQVQESIEANEAFVARLEALSTDQRQSFELEAFGGRQDLAGALSYRLSEHAMHTWDVAVALDPGALLSADAVELLIDTVLDRTARRTGKPAEGMEPVAVTTTEPDRTFTLTVTPEVTFAPGNDVAGDPLSLPAEALLRLVYGRLDPEHTPAGADDPRLTPLRAVFPGF